MKIPESYKHYTAFLDRFPNPVVCTDAKGKIIRLNIAAEKLFELPSDKLEEHHIDEFLTATDFSSGLSEVIINLPKAVTFQGQCLLRNAPGAENKVKISLSGIPDSNNENEGAIIVLSIPADPQISIHQLETINNTLANLGDNYFENIKIITTLCGELLGAASALYNRINEGLLCSIGKWNTAADHMSVVEPEGRICYDVIQNAVNDVFFVGNLPESSYAETDPNVKRYNLITYLGHMVRCNGEPVGSLCVVFQREYQLTFADQYIISRLALAIEAEETSESLRKSKNRYRELFDFAVEGILIGSPEGIITEANKSFQLMTGYEARELVGKPISEVLFSRENIDAKPFRFDLLREGQTSVIEQDIVCKDERIITVEMRSKLMPDHTYQSALFDISTRKEAEKRLNLSENTYSGIINSLNDAIYILDKDGIFLDVNKAAEKLYGYEKEFFLHKNPGVLAAPGMNDLEMTASFINEAYCGKTVRFEFWGLRKDGSVFPKEVSLSPGIWFDQKVVIAVGREMTERKQVEESLRISEEKYRMLVQYSGDPIFSYNTDETYRFVNDAFASPFGMKPEDIIGKTPYDIFPAEEAEKRLKLVRQVFRTGEKGEMEVKIVNQQDEEKYYLTMVDPVKSSEGELLWVTCMSKDITQRKNAEEELRLKNEQLKATNAEKDKFFSIVAHDLRGPMNGFLGLTGIMADDIESLSASELKEIATTMRTSAINIYRLIENLLEWSKMQRGILNFEPRPMFLKSALSKSIELLMDAANKKGIALRINIPEHNVVCADIHMLETIIRNLVSNALKFSYKEGVVEISAEKEENDMVRITVKDNGIGMNSDLVSKLFTLSENVNRKGTEGEPSTGLGLILCKEFVEKQGGKLWVESIEGVGSAFIFTLPQF